MKSKIILVGKAASGKDYFKNYLSFGLRLRPSVSHTTRPPREGEINGITYHFRSDEYFQKMIDNKEFFEWKEFNGWKYGTSISEMTNAIVFIFTPEGIKTLPKWFLDESLIVYFDIDEKVRKERLKLRSDADSIDRRIKADKKDFKNFRKYDMKVTEPNFNVKKLFKEVFREMRKKDVVQEK